jgi:hypothetical protein
MKRAKGSFHFALNAKSAYQFATKRIDFDVPHRLPAARTIRRPHKEISHSASTISQPHS